MPSPATIQQGVDRRRDILKFCKTYIKKNGYGPSLQEISDGVGLHSPSGVRVHLQTLVADGKITWQSGVYRSLRIVEKPKAKMNGRLQPV